MIKGDIGIQELSVRVQCYWTLLDFILPGFKLLGFKFVELQGRTGIHFLL
ncbi:hypothetical protein HID58_066274 [Brassica napus]|uniref:Uncharacterized protein n=1 Tax=Brassica napus TaxID=3708 RepID=A0ABQ7ZF94_BRANA|nr:hypothetical protein HID58_066274 [Brassica napus]